MLKKKKETRVVDLKKIKRNWIKIDATDQVLGRLASKVAEILQGKNKTYYSPNLDCGDYVVIVNSQRIKFTGKKIDNKIYRRYSGYPGGLKEITLKKLFEKSPELVIKKAIYNMLPKNKLRSKILKRLYIFKNEALGLSNKLEEIKI